MDKAVYITANGADQIMLAMQANNHNLANANTIGFKADVEVFKSLPVASDALDTRVYTETSDTTADFRPGTLIPTERELDVAIADKGWFVVENELGEHAYTRRGDLQVSPEGLLTTATGHPILGNAGPITLPPAAKIEISGDGTISLQPLGQSAETIVTIDRLKLVNPEQTQLRKGVDGLFYFMGEDEVETDSNVRVIAGSLESSNVNPVNALVNMINLNRQYEIQMKLVQSLEQNDTTSAQIMQID